jgi:isoleucyl-tRNA synthetase
MDRLREVASAALSLREERNLRVRLPLASVTLAGAGAASIEPLADLLADEVNVKTVLFSDDVETFGAFRLKPNGRLLGPKLGGDVQTVIKAAKAGAWTSNDDGTVSVGDHVLSPEEFELALDPKEGVAAAGLRGNDAIVVLDVELTDELEAEGLARDVVRLVQQARKDAELDVTDRINLMLGLDAETKSVLESHVEWIASQVLAAQVEITEPSATAIDLDGRSVSVQLSKS